MQKITTTIKQTKSILYEKKYDAFPVFFFFFIFLILLGFEIYFFCG